MARFQDEATGDRARLFWTLDCGAAPMARIYSTLKHLRSTLGMGQVEEMVKAEVARGTVLAMPHPLHEGQFFYRINGEFDGQKEENPMQ